MKNTPWAVVALFPCIMLASCVGLRGTSGLAPYQAQITAMKATIADLESASIVDQEKLDKAKEAVAALEAKGVEITERGEDATGIEAILEMAGAGVGVLGPQGTMVGLGLTTIAGFLRANRKSKKAKEAESDLNSLGKAVARVASNNNGLINTKDEAVKETLDLIMTPNASRVVRGHLGKNV